MSRPTEPRRPPCFPPPPPRAWSRGLRRRSTCTSTVGPRREDGYHDLTTVFHAVDLFDEVSVTAADALTVEVVGEGATGVPTDAGNLACAGGAAARHRDRLPAHRRGPHRQGHPGRRRLRGRVGRRGRRAGRLRRAVGHPAVPRGAASLGAQLGSDVPFSLHGGTALGTGRGEQLTPVLADGAATPGCWRWPTGGCPPRRSTPSWTASARPARFAVEGDPAAGAGGAAHRGPGGARRSAEQRPAVRRGGAAPLAAPAARRGPRARRARRRGVRQRADRGAARPATARTPPRSAAALSGEGLCRTVRLRRRPGAGAREWWR